MLRFIVKRLLLLPLLMLLFTVVVFALVQAPPGDFLTSYVAMLASSGSSMDAAQVEALKQQFGLDQPVHVQYFLWLGSIVRGDLGLSLEYQRPSSELIGERMLVTLLLALFAFVITWIVAIPAGIYAAMHKNTALDYIFAVLNYIGVATPNFMLALILMWVCLLQFRPHDHRAVLAPVYPGAVEPGPIHRSAQAYLAARDRAGRGRHRAPDAHHARQSAR